MDNIKRHGKYFIRKLLRESFASSNYSKELISTQFLNFENLATLQNQKLNKIIHHCYKNIPYYQDLFKELKIKPENITSKEDLKKLPFLDKYIVKDNLDKLISKTSPAFLRYTVNTSGTTGTPGKIIWDLDSINFENAMLKRYYNWHNINGLKKITLRGLNIVPNNQSEPPFWFNNIADKELIMSSYHLSKNTIKDYFQKIRQYKPDVLYAYPSTAFLLAKLLEENNLAYNFKAVLTSSENLKPEQKNYIETFFNTKVNDWYGQVERVSAIGHCEYGTYHILEDYSIVETIESAAGLEIVGTHLHNYTMPLLRYKTTDIIKLSDTKCPCGRHFRTVNEITGKSSEYYNIITDEGVKMTSLAYIPMGVKNLIETQIVQEKVNELIINVVTSKEFSKTDENQLIKNTIDRTTPKIKVIINQVSSISRGPNGKFQSVINKLLKQGAPNV